MFYKQFLQANRLKWIRMQSMSVYHIQTTEEKYHKLYLLFFPIEQLLSINTMLTKFSVYLIPVGCEFDFHFS